MSLMTSLYVPCASSPQHLTVEKVQSAKPLGSLPKGGGETTPERGWTGPQVGVLPCPPGAYESMLLAVPIRDIMPLGQKSRISRLPRRGWVMVTVTATCSRVLIPDCSRSAVLTGKGKVVRMEPSLNRRHVLSSAPFCPLPEFSQEGDDGEKGLRRRCWGRRGERQLRSSGEAGCWASPSTPRAGR